MKGHADMQENPVLQRFRQFRARMVASNISNSLLMEMIENYLTSDDDSELTENDFPVLDGQLSLFDTSDYKELVSV